MFGSDFKWTVGGGESGDCYCPTSPLTFLLSVAHLPDKNFSPDSSAAVNIEYGDSDFHQKNTEYPLTKITPVLPVSWLKFL